MRRARRGCDNAKKTLNGRKRHIAVRTRRGLLLAVVITTAASVQDRDAARPLLWNLHRTSRRVRLIWADAVYAGTPAAWAATMKMNLQIVPRRSRHTFQVPAPPLGRGADLRLDQQAPPHRPRLRRRLPR